MTTAVQKAPRIIPEDAVSIVADLYGLNVSAAPLPSERDQNFYCRDSNEELVLKIANPDEAIEFLELQNQLIRFLAASKIDLEFPRIVPTGNGEDTATIKDEYGREHFVRLLTWLDGTCFAKVDP